MKRAAPGLESFWETCDHESVDDHPLMRELCFRLDTIQRYHSLMDDAETAGNDEALAVLTAYFEKQNEIIHRIRLELDRQETLKSTSN